MTCTCECMQSVSVKEVSNAPLNTKTGYKGSMYNSGPNVSHLFVCMHALVMELMFIVICSTHICRGATCADLRLCVEAGLRQSQCLHVLGLFSRRHIIV